MNNINIYCDESHPTQNDGQDFMVLGAIICNSDKYKGIKKDLVSIRKKHGVDSSFEFKWQKVNKKRFELFCDFISYISSSKDLYLKINVALGKRVLTFSEAYTYETWYHKMYYYMLKNFVSYHSENDNKNCYKLFIDKKDSHSTNNYSKIASSLCQFFRVKGSFEAKACNSAEYLLIQCVDIIIGSVSYYYKKNYASKYKTALMRYIMDAFKLNFNENTDIKNEKVSFYIWKPEIRYGR